MLTIYAALYQNESEEKSYNIRWGIKRSFENIDTKYQNRICYGYCHDNDGKLIIEAAEASVVQEIFENYITGASLRQIAFVLNLREIKYLITGCNPVIISEYKFKQLQTEKMRRKSDKSNKY